MPIWRGNTYRFTVTSANATAGATYTNNGQTFTVTATIAAGTLLFCTGTGAPTAAGTLTRTSGTGDAAIVFSANVAPNVNWGTATNWDTGALPVAAAAGTDAIFDSASLNCTVNVAGVCRNLNFTGYTNTITMTNNITVGSTSSANPNHAVTLSPTMGIAGTGIISTRANGNISLRSNGRVWPNAFGIANVVAFANPTVTLLDNWTISGNLFIAPGGTVVVTFSGAFTISAGASVSIQTSGAAARIAATNGSLSTIKMTGTGTFGFSGIMGGFGLNLIIDAPGQTVTLGPIAGYGGLGVVTGSTFSYVAGTVVCTGTFYLHFVPVGAAAYTLNLSGDSSPSATTTNASGVNFNNLSIRSAATAGSQTCIISGNLCVVGTLSSTPIVVTRGPFLTSGGTIYLNGDMIHDATMRAVSSTVLVLQGTGTWIESTITVGSTWGLSWQVQINTTGTRTIGSLVGIRDGGSITYTAGTVVFSPGSGLYMNASSLYGFGSAGIIIPTVKNVTTSAGTASTINFYDTVPYQILDIEFVGGNGNFAWGVGGTVGFICDSFSCVLSSAVSSTALRLAAGIEYIVRTSAVLLAWQPTNNFTLGASSGTPIFTLLPGASQDIYYLNGGGGGTQVNSSNGQTVYTRGGLIASLTTNWKNWDFPKTRNSTFISQ